MKYQLEVGDACKVVVDVPEGENAMRIFLDAAEENMGINKHRYLALSTVHRSYAGKGGLFETYLMANGPSGHVYGSVWIEAYQL